MHQTVEAIYENGMLKLLEPLSLREQERVQVTVSKPETTAGNLEEVRKALSVIPGTLTEDFRLARDDE
jgi:predicted DNA-binding antitoxin AbrB/MazE fold protein